MRPAQWRYMADLGHVITAGLAMGAVVLALATVGAIGNQPPTLSQGLLLGAASVLLTLAFPIAPAASSTVRWPSRTGGRRLYLGIGLCVLGCMAAGAGGVSGYRSFDNLFYGGLLEYALGAVLLGAGLYLVAERPPRFAWTPLQAWLRVNTREVLAVSAVLLVGLALRLYQLDSYPPPQGFALLDEPQIGLAATGFLWHGQHPWQYPELVYTAALSFKLFGASLLTMRYPIELAGFVMLGIFYLFARQFFSVPVAVAGTALVAVSRWEISYTRTVLPSSTMMILELCIFLLAVWAVRGRATYLAYALMGALTGIGLYSHTSFRLVPLLLALWWIGWLIGQRDQLVRVVRIHLPGWLLFLAAAAIVALPYVGVVRDSGGTQLTERLTSIMPLLFNWGAMADPGALLRGNAASLLGYFTGPGDPWPAVNPPTTPMLDPITAALFLLGLGYGLLHARRPYIGMFLLWFLLTVIAGSLVTIDFRGERIVAAIPSVYLLACLTLEVLWQWIRTLSVPMPHRAMRTLHVPRYSPPLGVALASLLVAGWTNADTLFNRQAHDPTVRTTYQPPSADLVVYLRDHHQGTYSYQLADFNFADAGSDYGWAAGEPQGRNGADLADLLPVHDAPAGMAAQMLFAQPYPVASLARAVALVYPHATVRYWGNPETGNRYSAVVVSAAQLTADQGLAGPCPQPVPCTPGAWRPLVGHGAIAYWSGSIYIPVDGTYMLTAGLSLSSGSLPTLRLDGRLLRSAVALYPGWHTLVIATRGRAVGAPLLRWTGPGLSGVVPVTYLHERHAHGLLLQFLPASGGQPLLAPQRVPFPFFLFPPGHNRGRPWVVAADASYRAVFTATVAPGHAGTYAMDLFSLGAGMSVFLDKRLVESSQAPVSGLPADTPLRLHLTGRTQVLQVECQVPATGEEEAGCALFHDDSGGAQTFLPWEWLSPPPEPSPLPAWLLP